MKGGSSEVNGIGAVSEGEWIEGVEVLGVESP